LNRPPRRPDERAGRLARARGRSALPLALIRRVTAIFGGNRVTAGAQAFVAARRAAFSRQRGFSMKHVVLFNGSPRMDGNIATIVNTVARGARDNGAEATIYTLFKMKFMACQSCFNCRLEKGDCAVNDEITVALKKVKTADAVVIGSPIYMMQMTGPVKNLYDRFFPLMDSDYRPRYGTKKLLTVYSQGMADPQTFESYFQYTAAMHPAFGFELVDNIVCTNANDPESAERNAGLKIRAYELGKVLVA
jgi:multimeric flavodoxin WrbA